jgi:hypothetical protein
MTDPSSRGAQKPAAAQRAHEHAAGDDRAIALSSWQQKYQRLRPDGARMPTQADLQSARKDRLQDMTMRTASERLTIQMLGAPQASKHQLRKSQGLNRP